MRLHPRRIVLWLVGITCCSFFLLQAGRDLSLNISLQTYDTLQRLEDVMKAANSSGTSAKNDSSSEFSNAKEGYRTGGGKEQMSKRDLSREVYPYGDEIRDRILEQMQLKLPFTKNKTILMYNGGLYTGNTKFIEDECPMTNCIMTNDRAAIDTADAILFKGSVPRRLTSNNTNQVRVVYILESPHHSTGFVQAGTYVNWTATYRRDSVLNTPYERFTPYPGSVLPDKASRNYAEGKTKMAAWFVSHCKTVNGRENYVHELQKYISVDIYGGCGPLKCPRRNNELHCFDYLNKDYKFYLAFENSNCKDYITEKFFANGLQNDVLPVVMGAHPEDYKRSSPANSYIHVDDFASPRHLADYLLKLDANDDLYNEYFRWKGTGEFINTKFWCRLCSMVNTVPDYPMWYDSIGVWWRGNGICKFPEHSNFSTWRNTTRSRSFIKTVKYGYQSQILSRSVL